jgi:hypothetical protein
MALFLGYPEHGDMLVWRERWCSRSTGLFLLHTSYCVFLSVCVCYLPCIPTLYSMPRLFSVFVVSSMPQIFLGVDVSFMPAFEFHAKIFSARK